MSHVTRHSHTSQCLLYINSVHCLYNITALDQLPLSSQVVHSTQQVSWSSSSSTYIGIASTQFSCQSFSSPATGLLYSSQSYPSFDMLHHWGNPDTAQQSLTSMTRVPVLLWVTSLRTALHWDIQQGISVALHQWAIAFDTFWKFKIDIISTTCSRTGRIRMHRGEPHLKMTNAHYRCSKHAEFVQLWAAHDALIE